MRKNKDNIKLHVRILHAWLQPLYNNQQVKNMEMIVMNEHNTNMQAIVRMDKLKRFRHHLKEGAMRLNARCGDYAQQFNDFLNSCDDHGRIVLVLQFTMICGTVGTIITIQEDEGWWYLGCWACRGKVIKSTNYIDLESEMPKKPDGPNDWWCRKCNAWVALNKSQFRLQIRVQDETQTMSLSLFNYEVQAMVGRSAYQLCEKYAKRESHGFILKEITNLIGNEYAFKVSIDDYNVKKLLPVFTVLRFSNDQEIINYVLVCATLIKDLESQTDENTTPNEKQKTNKRSAEGELGRECSTGKKRDVEIKPIYGCSAIVLSLLLYVQLEKRRMFRDGELGEANNGEVSIHVPKELLIDAVYDPVTSIIDFTYPNLLNNINNSSYFQEKAILSPTNEVVDTINDHLLNKFRGEEMVYLSCDNIDKNERDSAIDEVVFSPEFINGLKFSGVPNHRLALKVGVPKMLLQNIDQANELCNRTRLRVLRLTRTSIQEKIINGTHFGNKVIIPRQPWVVRDDDEDFDVYETYTDLFSIKVNYGD
nr:replication protein A 70 kDa DNA-binding subunit B [Tanacetum cinerariifolium]